MAEIESIDKSNWKEFVESDAAVLMLARTDCDNCDAWTEELGAFLEEDETFSEVRFGKMFIDKPGLAEFKKANPWLKDVRNLPYNIIWIDGEAAKKFAGSGVNRLTNRLERLLD